MKKEAPQNNQQGYTSVAISIADFPPIKTTRLPAQRNYILNLIMQFGSANTIELKRLGIIYPPARVCELISKGYPIERTRETWFDDAGVEHNRITRYWLRYSENECSNN